MSRASDEAPAVDAARGFEEQSQTTAPSVHDAERKKFETIRARLAFKGYELRRQADGTLLVVRWNLARVLPDLDAAERFAIQAGVHP